MTHHDSGPHDQPQHWPPGPGKAGPGAVSHRVQGGQAQEVTEHRVCWGTCDLSVVRIKRFDWSIVRSVGFRVAIEIAHEIVVITLSPKIDLETH